MEEIEISEVEPRKKTSTGTKKVEPMPSVFLPLKDRGISKIATQKFGVTYIEDKASPFIHLYPYTRKGKHVANKVRGRNEKTFRYHGDSSKLDLFGQSVFPAGSAKTITITEGECLSPETEVLVKDLGWISLADYTDQGPVMTGTGEYVTPTAKVVKTTTEGLLNLKSGSLHLPMTLGHTVITEGSEPTQARDVKWWKARIPRTVQAVSGSGIPLSNDELALALAVQVDGRVAPCSTKGSHVKFRFKKARKIERLVGLLDRLGVEYNKRESSGITDISVSDLPEWVGGTYLNWDWLYQATSDQRKFLLEELTHWDGNHVKGRNQTEFSNIHKENADWVQTLCHLSGITSTVMPRTNQYGSWYKVSLLHSKTHSTAQKPGQRAVSNVGEEVTVMCLQTNGSLLVRYEGSISVTGNCDALAVFDMQGDWPVVSIRSASTAVSDCQNAFEYLNSFEEIKVCLDADDPGQSAATKIADLFPLGKVKIVTLRAFKDPNEYLRAGETKKFTKEWWGAPTYTPAGLKLGSELWDEVINPPNHETIFYPFEGLNEKTYGMRLSEFVVFNAPPKVGKTTLLGEITYHILKNNDENTKVGLMKLEESNRDSALNLMSLHANKRLHLPDVWEETSTEDIKKYFDETINTDRVVVWDHFGSNSVQAVLDKVRHMHALGCKYIILDHISIVVSDQQGDERKQLDEIATKLKTLCMELNICVLAVVHQNRQGEIRGTQGIEQLANMIIKLERDKLADNDFLRNLTKLTVSENRFCGETGTACYVYYDQETGRLKEVDEQTAEKCSVTGEAPW